MICRLLPIFPLIFVVSCVGAQPQCSVDPELLYTDESCFGLERGGEDRGYKNNKTPVQENKQEIVKDKQETTETIQLEQEIDEEPQEKPKKHKKNKKYHKKHKKYHDKMSHTP